MALTSPEPGTIIYIIYIKYELHRKYRTYLFKVFMASAVQNRPLQRIPKNLVLSSKNIDCVNSLETSRRDASKECNQSRFNMVKQVENNVPGIGI